MAFITSPQVLRIQNAAGANVIASARTLKFIGGIVVTDGGQGTAVIDGMSVDGNPWDVLGNAGGGLLIGTNTADSWDMIVNAARVAGFDADGKFDISGKSVLSLSDNPSIGAGVTAEIGSIGMLNFSGAGQLWLKFGAADTEWVNLSIAFTAWGTFGNNLNGANPSAPNQLLGSSNDFDVVFTRNALNVMRLIQDGQTGLLIGGDTHLGNSAARLELQTSANNALFTRESLRVGGVGPSATELTRMALLTTIGPVSASTDLTVNNDLNQLLSLNIIVKQVGGSVGAVGDGAAFKFNVVAQNIGGAVTILAQQPGYSYSVDPGITVNVTAVGNAVRVTVNGVVNRGLRWAIFANSTNIS